MTAEEEKLRLDTATRRIGLVYHAYRALDGRVHSWSVEPYAREFRATIASRDESMALGHGYWPTTAVSTLAVHVCHRFAHGIRHTEASAESPILQAMSNALFIAMSSAKAQVRDKDLARCEAASKARKRIETLVREWASARAVAPEEEGGDRRAWFFRASPVESASGRRTVGMTWRLHLGSHTLGEGPIPEAALYQFATNLAFGLPPETLTTDAAQVLREVLYP